MSIFINEITASDAGPDIIRSHLLIIVVSSIMFLFSQEQNKTISTPLHTDLVHWQRKIII